MKNKTGLFLLGLLFGFLLALLFLNIGGNNPTSPLPNEKLIEYIEVERIVEKEKIIEVKKEVVRYKKEESLSTTDSIIKLIENDSICNYSILCIEELKNKDSLIILYDELMSEYDSLLVDKDKVISLLKSDLDYSKTVFEKSIKQLKKQHRKRMAISVGMNIITTSTIIYLLSK